MSWCLRMAGLAIACLLAMTASEVAAAGAKRVALVIGNTNYSAVASLPNAVNDARAIGNSLRALGFDDVELAIDQTANHLRAAVQQFSRRAAAAEVAVVFYAGHGAEFGGNNYLIPTDAQLKTDVDVDFEAIPLDLVLRAVEPAKSFRLVILDACRDNPFQKQMVMSRGSTRSLGRGLARVDPVGDTLVAFAAKAGSIAADGTGANSPFTTALLQHLPTPGVDIRLVLGRVRDTVVELTNRQQEPHVYGSIGGREVYLRPATGMAPQPSSAATATPAPFDPRAIELSYWESVRNSNSPVVLKSYLERYPNGEFAALARAHLADLEQQRLAALPPLAQSQSAPPAVPAPAPQPPVVASPGGILRIGVAGPMTGPNAAFGAQLKNGADQAIEDINAAGGILGQKIAVNYGDDGSDPRQGISIANRFAAEGVKFVIGHFNSGVTMPTSEIYQQKGIVQITPSSSNPRITERGLWNIFRTCGRDDHQAIVAGDYILRNFRGRRIAIVHDKTTYGQGLADETRSRMRAGGMNEALYEGVNLGEKDFSALVSRIKASRADLVYWGGLHTEAAMIVRQMRQHGVSAPLMGGDGITSDEFATIGGAGVEGTLMTYGSDPRLRPEARAVVPKFRAKRFEPESYTLYSYAAVEILKQAADAARSVDPKAIAAHMRSGQKFKTVIGEISYDKKGDVTRLDYVVYVWKKNPEGKITYTEIK